MTWAFWVKPGVFATDRCRSDVTDRLPAPILLSLILMMVAQACDWLCFGWVLPVPCTHVSAQRPTRPPRRSYGYGHAWRVPGAHCRETSTERLSADLLPCDRCLTVTKEPVRQALWRQPSGPRRRLCASEPAGAVGSETCRYLPPCRPAARRSHVLTGASAVRCRHLGIGLRAPWRPHVAHPGQGCGAVVARLVDDRRTGRGPLRFEPRICI